MAVIDLAQRAWWLTGWRPFIWKMEGALQRSAMQGPELDAPPEASALSSPESGPYPAVVPGSVQEALRRAGVLPDWNVGVNSRLCEWVEHRHWLFSTWLPATCLPQDARVVLAADGLDHAGWIIVDGQEIARFEGALIPHRFDLTAWLADGADHRLGLMFEEPPREQGQFGFTSLSRHFKPRYGYSWDWCPRFVPIGVWDALRLETGADTACHIQRLACDLSADLRHGALSALVEIDAPIFFESGADLAELRLILSDQQRELARASAPIAPGANFVHLDKLDVEPWWPNGEGPPRTYTLDIQATTACGEIAYAARRTVGFKRVEWRPCEGASADAEPWLCTVNNRPIFLRGANWVPPRASYADATPEEYARLIRLYREMGANLLRVWGGGILEKESFYEACDQAGILVWQEFPLSSSGVDNAPPEDPKAIHDLCTVARHYIRRRGHHASLLMWCGGNELSATNRGMEPPVAYDHPCIAALREVVREHAPSQRFLAASPSGPRAWRLPGATEHGVFHEIHGPWGLGDMPGLDAWRAYWEADDALFRSEVGMPGAMNAEKIRVYAGALPAWPPDTEYWIHTAAWWRQWNLVKERLAPLEHDPRAALDAYVRLTQELQAEAYAIAAKACKQRFPRCGGFIVWMGHDCFPCPANNAFIDCEGEPKPAYFALQHVFLSPCSQAST